MNISNPCKDFVSMSPPSSPSSSLFYSAPSSHILANALLRYESHMQQKDGDLDSNLNDFEFETSKKYRYHEVGSERSQSFVYPRDDKPKAELMIRRGDSLPVMAFADKLFSNGIVLPLKLPPGLQSTQGEYLRSTASSPTRSPSSILKVQFPRLRSKWDDEFDPFVVALQKVSEEKRGRNSMTEAPHRRTRSLSPFKASLPQGFEDHTQIEYLQKPMTQKHNELVKPKKKSASARWFGRGNKSEPKKKLANILRPKHCVSPSGWRASVTKVGRKGTKKNEESRRNTVKGFLKKYSSFGRERNELNIRRQIVALWKKSSLGKLSFKMKENYA